MGEEECRKSEKNRHVPYSPHALSGLSQRVCVVSGASVAIAVRACRILLSHFF